MHNDSQLACYVIMLIVDGIGDMKGLASCTRNQMLHLMMMVISVVSLGLHSRDDDDDYQGTLLATFMQRLHPPSNLLKEQSRRSNINIFSAD